jgi:hypothetical protein
MKIEQILETGGSLIGGAIGNGIETGVSGYETYEDIRHHDYIGAVHDGAETIIHGIETGIDIYSGDIF